MKYINGGKTDLILSSFFSRQSCEKNITHSKKIFTFLKEKRENSICFKSLSKLFFKSFITEKSSIKCKMILFQDMKKMEKFVNNLMRHMASKEIH